jgi:hypothetical protein
MSRAFDAAARPQVAAALEAAVPGCVELGAVEYVEELLGALDHDPPHVWAAPGSWAGGDGRWIELGPWELDAWRRRIDGFVAVYRRVAAGTPEPGDERTVHEHACEAAYGDPAYGGNRGGAGWARIGFPEPLFPPARGT